MSSEVPASDGRGEPTTRPADAATAVVAPDFDVGAGLRAMAFAPGRFATAIQRSQAGTHARNLVREDSTASLTLTLAADGSARACRGWRYLMTNDGPGVHTDDRFREQAGFRGTWTERAGVVVVELASDDGVCAPVGEYTTTRARATTLPLRCVLATPDGHPTLTAPVLVCEWAGAPSSEQRAHAVSGLGPVGAIVLGAAPGLRVKLEGGLPGMVSLAATTMTATVAAVADDAWTTAF